MALLQEIRRRNVHRVALAYLAGAWLLIQVADTVLPRLGFADAAVTGLIILLGVGFVPAVVLSWVFEWTPEGPRRDADPEDRPPAATGRRLDRAIVVTLALAVGYFALDKFLLDPARDALREREVAEQARSAALVESYQDKSIAVLPFVNMSSDPEQEYFSDGIAEEILNLLARVDGLRVISRSSAFSFKGKEFKVPEVGDALNVAHVLEGSVRRAGNTVRITAQLIDARSDTHLWSESYEREIDDVFAIQEEIAAAISDQLKVAIIGKQLTAHRADPRAYPLYLHARYLINTSTDEGYAAAAPLVEQALAIDPDYVEALILRLRLIINTDDGWASSAEFHAVAHRIVAIDPDNEAANGVQSWVALYVHRDIEKAARYLERAMRKPTTDVESLRGLAHIFAPLGLNEEAVAVYEYIVDRDPTCLQCRYLLASAYRRAWRFPEAEAMMQSAVNLMPANSAYKLALARTKLLNGKAQSVLDWISSEEEQGGDQAAALKCMALHAVGRTKEARELLERVVAEASPTVQIAAAEALAWTGDVDRAFEFLHRPRQDYVYDVANNPFFAGLHDDPRWHAYLAGQGVAPEQLAALDIKIQLPPGVKVTKKTAPGNARGRN